MCDGKDGGVIEPTSGRSVRWDGCSALLCVCFVSTLPAGLEAHNAMESLLLEGYAVADIRRVLQSRIES